MRFEDSMKVLILIHGLFPGFVAPVGKEYAKHLCRLGVDVAVAVIGKRYPSAEAEPLKFPVYVIEEPNIFKSYKSLSAIVKHYDLVHYFPGKGFELLPLFAGKAKFIFNRLSVSVTGKPLKDKFIDFLNRLQPLFASCVVFTDEALAKAIRPFFRKRVRLMPVGYADDLFFPCHPPNGQSEKVLIYHGAVRPQRHLDQLISVIARLPSEYKLSIIGGGLASDEAYRDHLGNVAKDLGCSDRVNLTNMPQAHIRAEIEKSYMGLSYIPMWECYQEQFVLKTLEYLACNRPVLATATRYSLRFSQHIGENRILLTDGTVDDMVEKIIGAGDYVNSFYQRENLKTLQNILEPYSTRHLVENHLLEIYRSVLSDER
jgi:glycosyltransferase involved in cell wall biosynthesis